MFVVKFYDYGICYLTHHSDPNCPWVMRAAVKKAAQFKTEKAAERAFKEYFPTKYGHKLHQPVKNLHNVEIIQIKED